jgi:hypothetical protein
VNKDRHGGLRRHCDVTSGREPVAGWFCIAPNDERIVWTVDAPAPGDMPAQDRVPASDLAALDALDPAPKSLRDVKARLRWRSERAGAALREWRRLRSLGDPGDQGSLPLHNSAEQPSEMCSRCHHEPAEVLDRCRGCAYPTRPDTDDRRRP